MSDVIKNPICNHCKYDYTDNQLEIVCMDENNNCQICRAELSGKFADGKSLMIGADMVNNPPHYKDASGIECIEVTSKMSFCGGNCFKYLYRAGKKGSTIEDLKKAAWYAEQARLMGEITDIRLLDKIIKIAEYRSENISNAMECIFEDMWADAKRAIEREITRLESE